MTARIWRPDGAGSWRSPAGVGAVTDRNGQRWVQYGVAGGGYWRCEGAAPLRWYRLVAAHGPVTQST